MAKVYENPENIYNREKDLSLSIDTKGSKIVEFLSGKSIFITGASGFLGKILIEKLLRAAPDIENIFVLCRDKKGKDMLTRMDEILNDIIFSKLNEMYPKFRHKVIPIKGDVGLERCGISNDDRHLLTSKVQIIFHCAATVRFDEKIKLAAEINIRGTREMLLLAKECSNLESYVHVSTAFANCPRSFIEEKLYPAPMTLKEIFEFIENHTDEELAMKTNEILGQWPNTYAYTKAIAEETVKEFCEDLPVCIFRPAIVVSTYKEPLRGWIDNVYGPTGVITGAGVGLLHSLHCEENNVAEIVPVDLVVNAMIASAYKNINKTTKLPIYNYVSSCENSLTWKNFMHLSSAYGCQVPTIQSIWYYSFTLNRYRALHLFYVLLFHYIPAYIMDAGSVLVGKKPQLVKVYKKIGKFTNVISYFSTRCWKFENKNVQTLWEDLNETDKAVFPFSISKLDWNYFFEMATLGMRMYLIKDDISTLPQARKKWYRLYLLHSFLKVIVCSILIRYTYKLLALIF